MVLVAKFRLRIAPNMPSPLDPSFVIRLDKYPTSSFSSSFSLSFSPFIHHVQLLSALDTFPARAR